MPKAVNDKTAVTLSLRTAILLAGLLVALSGAFWKTQTNINANQHAIETTLLEMRHNREKLEQHLQGDVVLQPSDVREALRTP